MVRKDVKVLVASPRDSCASSFVWTEHEYSTVGGVAGDSDVVTNDSVLITGVAGVGI